MKLYKLLNSDGEVYESAEKGQLGGNSREKIYGTLDCTAANNALGNNIYENYRVFFANESVAIAAGYRPCGRCLKSEYKKWKESQEHPELQG
ncbi:Ada metal-binding domain-containing protein [Microbulbifer hydrolyticus]|nr:Ada metal-binding domain-containing protein [Microbulbifer hydrolyticus]MBB5212558.1 hypothetical protein [Microbulbifer hydrolyticus]